MSYCVVVSGEDWCSSIPSSWVDFETATFSYPSKNASIAICKNVLPLEIWQKKTFTKYYGPYDTLEEARKVENDTVYDLTSDCQDLQQLSKNNIPNKRRGKTKLYSEDYEVDIDAMTSAIPSPPYCNERDTALTSVSDIEENTFSSLQCYQEINKKFEDKKIKEMLAIINKKLDTLLHISASTSNNNTNLDLVYDDLPDFPINSITILKEFEHQLKNKKTVRQQFESKIKVVG
ncbi:uncharacterized protein [Prorops nasuta]|uniref:uncharacterized protein n=1 Tax=Prorops nasuta TaxID=863751 RepID=UPI0034CEF98F